MSCNSDNYNCSDKRMLRTKQSIDISIDNILVPIVIFCNFLNSEMLTLDLKPYDTHKLKK